MDLARRTRILLVTGGTGFLGRHLTSSGAARNWQIIAPARRSLDVRDGRRVLDAIRSWRPAAVAHLADDHDDRRTTVDGSVNVARACAATGARLVHLSSDLVFAGRPRPYEEDDAPEPVTTFGEWKLAAERLVAEANPGALVLRTSVLYGTTRLSPAQLDVERAIREHTGMSFLTDEYRCPAHGLDVARAIAELARRRDLSGPLHLAGPEVISRAELARRTAELLGLDPRALSTASIAESGLRRPTRIALDSSKANSLGFTCRPMRLAMQP